MYDELQAKNEALSRQLEDKERAEKELEEKKKLAAIPLQLPDPNATPRIPYVEKEFVKVRLFRDDYRYKDALYVGINNKDWMIPRGVEMTLPKYVADFIEQQMQADDAIWERVAIEEKNYMDQTAKLG